MNSRKTFPLISILNRRLIDLASPSNLNVNWNYGSILGLILANQLFTGLLLSIRFTAHVRMSFTSVINICQDSEYGWLLRLIHARGASLFFLFLYLHISRGIYYGSYTKIILWNLGVVIYLVLIGTAFLGYVLPWGQMSYWAATVITNLLRAIPIVGRKLVIWVWGGFAVGNPTLTRFYSLHFLLPFIVVGLVFLHVYYLHLYGRGNPLGVDRRRIKISFHYYFRVKDSLFFLGFIAVLILFSCIFGYNFIDPENFIPANILVTPIHIQPEWYFLFAYAILRAIPNKLGGVVALVAAVLILFAFPINRKKALFAGLAYRVGTRFLFWTIVATFIVLTWLGSCPAEYPFIGLAEKASLIYFIVFLLAIIIQPKERKFYLN